MSFLFNIEGLVCKPKAECLLVSPYKDIWDRDRSKDKGKAIKDLTFIELYTSKLKSNPYSGYSDDLRLEKLSADVYGEVKRYDDLDELVKSGIDALERLQKEGSPTYTYYVSQLKAVEKLTDFFLSFDLNERNDRGQLIYKPKEITSSLADADKITQNLTVLRDKVEQELYTSTKNIGNRKTGAYEE